MERLWLTVSWEGVGVPEAVQERETVALFREVMALEGVERVQRVPDPGVPEGAMGAAWLWGILQAEVTVANAGKVAKEIRDRLPGKPISFTIKGPKGGEVSAENVRPENLEETLAKLVAAAKDL